MLGLIAKSFEGDTKCQPFKKPRFKMYGLQCLQFQSSVCRSNQQVKSGGEVKHPVFRELWHLQSVTVTGSIDNNSELSSVNVEYIIC